jgi:allantoin racemase
MLDRATRCRRSETELVFNPVPGLDMGDLGSRFYNDVAMVDGLQEAMQPDVDGAIMHCYFDPGLWPARRLLDVPIVGLAEASMNLASYIGRRFAVMTVSPRYVPAMEDTIHHSGHGGHAISHRPVRAIDADEATAMRWFVENRLDLLVETATAVGRGCIADGADVLILGCGLVSVLLSEGAGVGDIDGVPVITPVAAAIKAVESLVDLQRSGTATKSAVGYWGSR